MSKGRTTVALAVLALLAAGRAAAGESWTPVRAFRSFSKAQWRGLPQSSVVSLAQDAQGVLWIGTFDGLAWFDGRTLEPVAAAPGAPVRGVINALAARPGGGIYAGTPGGVHVFDGQAWSVVPASRSVAGLSVAPDGTLWMVDVDGALWTMAGSTWQRHVEIATPAVAVSAAEDGAVWVATRTGAVRVRDGAVEPVAGTLTGPPSAILAAHDGRAWLATLDGTLYWSGGVDPEWHAVAIEGWARGRFRSLAEDRRGRIWAGTLDGAVAWGTPEEGFRTWTAENGPFLGGVMAVLGDREGSVWFGFNGAGMAQWIGEEWSHRVTLLDPQRPAERIGAWGLSRTADGSLLMSAFAPGFVVLPPDGPARQYGDAQGLTEDVRHTVSPEPGTFWAGGRFGLYESKGGRPFVRALALANGFVTGLFKSPQGRWYAATSATGVYAYADGQWQPEASINAGLDDPYVRGMTWTRAGEAWVGTLRGVSVFRDGRLLEKISIRTEPALPESVNAVVETAEGTIWAGGIGGIGVRRDGRWQRLTLKDGLPGQTIYSLGVAPDGAVWAGGSGGVGRFADGRWTVWDTRTGLLEDECNLNGMIVGEKGDVYVSTMGSLAHFDPHVRPLAAPPLQLAWRDAPASGSELRDRALRLSWSAAWLGPQPVEYRVRVARLRDDWSEPSKDDHIDIQNVAAGDWEVEVEARVEGTREWSAPLTLRLTVPPLWHETWTARLGLIVLVGLVAAGLVRLRLAALRQRAAELEATVQQRTAELAEKVQLLSVSEQRAQEASRAKSAFLANMSHELRTPLNGVLGFAQLMARRPGRDPEDRRNLGTILRSGEHLLGLINDVLSLARIEAGGASLKETRFELRALLRGVDEMLRPRAETRGLDLRLDVDPALPRFASADTGKLRQVLLNLVGNAVKFTERGHVVLRARAGEAGRAEFEVEDTGPGIAPEEMAGLFAPFVQTETGRATREGTGLGLALSRELARLMGGDLTVRSERGRGSSFRLEIPLAAADALDEAEAPARRVVRLAPGQPEWRLLVVDDVAENREVLGGLLRAVGFVVEEAGSGEEAIVAWRRFEPHLIWMDKRMSGIDGTEATRRIRAESAREGRPDVKILVISASALSHEVADILASGCDDFVAKPFREATIFQKLEEHLGVRFETEEAAAAAAPNAPAEGDGRPRVLVVDDQPINRELVRVLLRERGMDVTEAAGGQEALALLDRDRYDAVILDVEMPGLDGLETVRAIRGRAPLRTLPVVAVTAHQAEGDRERLVAAGMSDYVAKPIEPDELGRVLARHLAAR